MSKDVNIKLLQDGEIQIYMSKNVREHEKVYMVISLIQAFQLDIPKLVSVLQDEKILESLKTEGIWISTDPDDLK